MLLTSQITDKILQSVLELDNNSAMKHYEVNMSAALMANLETLE